MANKNDNKSMFLYTALIFIVAVLLIIFSFLGQTNMQKNQPQVSESPDKEMSISEKATPMYILRLLLKVQLRIYFRLQLP